MSTNLPIPITPIAPNTTRLIPLPIHYGNAPLSLLSVMLFPDDLNLARKAVAHFLSSGTLQNTLGSGVQIDNRYMAEIITDLADGQPDQRLVRRRRYWASAVGQVVKVLFALVNSDDERVRERASWEEAVRIAERYSDRTSERASPGPPFTLTSAKCAPRFTSLQPSRWRVKKLNGRRRPPTV